MFYHWFRKILGTKPQEICCDIPFFWSGKHKTHQKSNSFGKRRAKCKDLKEHLINLVKKTWEVAWLLRLPLIIGCNRLCTKVQRGTKSFANWFSKLVINKIFELDDLFCRFVKGEKETDRTAKTGGCEIICGLVQ